MLAHLDQNKKFAVENANALKHLINIIQHAKKKPLDVVALKKEYKQLAKRIAISLGTILAEAQRDNLTEIDNYYYRFLLQQLSRFNQYFTKITVIHDERSGKTSAKPGDFSLVTSLEDAGLQRFEHPLLAQTAPSEMTATIIKDGKYREHYTYPEDGERYFYNKKTTSAKEKHQDRDHYFKANKKIGGATQSSNLGGIFKRGVGQAINDYFKPAQRDQHATEQRLFLNAIQKIQNAEVLNADEQAVLQEGKYYRYPASVKFKVPQAQEPAAADAQPQLPNHQTTHIGHAAELTTFDNKVSMTLVIDPVHFQSGTDTLIQAPAKLLYDRQTSPAFATSDYPATQVVLISHNHHDHMCPRSLIEGFSANNTLYITPKGDEKHMKVFGRDNVIELGSWNDAVKIEMKNGNTSSSYEIRSFPAKHASNRGALDLYESLYMGYMVRDLTKDHVVIYTGDTAVLDKDHFDQLRQYLLDNDLTISSACIAHGPDRPRKWMECTHQSTADAIAMHARFNLINAEVITRRSLKAALTPEQLNELSTQELLASSTAADSIKAACHAIGYHQGCYRLGLLSISDVETTVTRMLSVLHSLQDVPLNSIDNAMLKNNFLFQFLDTFEQVALAETIGIYQQYGNLTTKDVIEIITSHLTIPQPGATSNLAAEVPNPGFKFNYENLIQNRNPTAHTDSAAYEYFAKRFDPKLYQGKIDLKKLTAHALQLYIDRDRFHPKESKKSLFNLFLNRLPHMNDQEIKHELGKMHVEIFPKQDEGIRDESHSHTLLTILAGLIEFPEFRQQFAERQLEVASRLGQKNRP